MWLLALQARSPYFPLKKIMHGYNCRMLGKWLVASSLPSPCCDRLAGSWQLWTLSGLSSCAACLWKPCAKTRQGGVCMAEGLFQWQELGKLDKARGVAVPVHIEWRSGGRHRLPGWRSSESAVRPLNFIQQAVKGAEVSQAGRKMAECIKTLDVVVMAVKWKRALVDREECNWIERWERLQKDKEVLSEPLWVRADVKRKGGSRCRILGHDKLEGQDWQGEKAMLKFHMSTFMWCDLECGFSCALPPPSCVGS